MRLHPQNPPSQPIKQSPVEPVRDAFDVLSVSLISNELLPDTKSDSCAYASASSDRRCRAARSCSTGRSRPGQPDGLCPAFRAGRVLRRITVPFAGRQLLAVAVLWGSLTGALSRSPTTLCALPKRTVERRLFRGLALVLLRFFSCAMTHSYLRPAIAASLLLIRCRPAAYTFHHATRDGR